MPAAGKAATAATVLLADTRHRKLRPWIEWSCTLMLVFAIYRMSPIISSGDSHFVIPTALSILNHGDPKIDDYSALFSDAQWAVVYSHGHFYNTYPIGVALIVLPAVCVWDGVKALSRIDLEAAAMVKADLALELTLASLLTAVAVSLFFCYCRRRLSLARSALLTFLFAFGTSAYSSASRGMWQHGPSMLLFLASILVFDRLEATGWKSVWACILLGFLTAFSFSVRPSNLIVIASLGILTLIKKGTYFLAFLVGAAIGLAPMIYFDLSIFGTILSPYYQMTMGGATQPFHWRPFLGLLISPSRGVLIFSPFLAVVVLRFWPSVLKKHPISKLEIVLAALVLIWIYGTAKFPNWWGGGSYGPRLLCETFPCLLVLLIPLAKDASFKAGMPQKALAAAFLVLGGVSVAIHFRGATSEDVWRWNGVPVGIDHDPERAWAWHNIQFLSGLAKHRR